MRTRFAFAAVLLLATLPAVAQGVDVPAERARIGAERRGVEARFVDEEKACRGRFAVNDCTAGALARKREALAGLRHQEVALNDMVRRRRAAERLRDLEERQASARQETKARERASAAREHREREVSQADKTVRRASAQAASPGGKPRQVASGPRAPAITPEQAAANRAKHEQRLKEAEEHRAKAAQRKAQRKKPPASALPPPQAGTK